MFPMPKPRFGPCLQRTLTCAMPSGHSNMDKRPPTEVDPHVHSSGEASEKAVKSKKKKRRRSSSVRGTAGIGDSLEPNGIAHPQQQPVKTPASPHRTGSVPDTASASSGRLSSPIPRSRRNSEDVVGSPKASGMGGASLPTDHHRRNSDLDVNIDHHHHHDNGNDDQDEGVVIQRDTLSSSGSAHPAAKKEKGEKRKEKDGRHKKHPQPIPAVGDAAGGGSTDCSSESKTELARSRRKRTDQEAGGSDEPPSGIPYALPTSGSRATPFKAHAHRRSLVPPEGSRDTPTAPETRPRGLPNNSGGAAGAASAEAAEDRNSGDRGTANGGGVAVSGGRKRPRDAVGGSGGGGGGGGGGSDGTEAVVAHPGSVSQGRLPRKHLEQRKGLPIFSFKADIIRAVKGHQTVVIVGETGSGKSTQIPQFLYEAGVTGGGTGWGGNGQAGAIANGIPASDSATTARNSGGGGGGKGGKGGKGAGGGKNGRCKGGVIACTQPRRVAAVTVAKRVAAEAGSELGHVVGYTVRFDDCTTKSTRIKYMTDGVLLREAMSDPLLSAYSAVVLDEAHERSLDTDILFGLIRRLQPKRPDLKVIVMSATLDVDLFRRFFRDSISLHVPGRTHPVDVMYAKEDQDDYLDACLVTCLQIHEEAEGDGDVLVFLPGQDDIEALSQLLRDNLATLRAEKSRELAASRADAAAARGQEEFHTMGAACGGGLRGEEGEGLLRESMVCPVFAALPQEQQLEAFEPAPAGTRKFVLATNIAETSITINGIRYVVDSGKVKVRSYQPSTGMEFLRSRDVSKAQATQRAGRAGREAPGVCYRLFREDAYLELGDAPTPEILRVNLAQVVLQLKVMGVQDPSTFDYVTAPSRAAVLKALKTLVMLGALDKAGDVTPDGKKMAVLPLDPAFAHLLVRSAEPQFACVKEILTTVACLSAENLLFYPPKEEARRAADEAHRAFAAYEGDLPTLLRVYEGFLKERKDPTWCRRNFVNGRSVVRAIDVRQQLAKILRERWRIDPEESCQAETSQYLRCLVAGLFSNVAMRQAATSGGGGRGCYRTLVGGREAQIHPSSSLWRRNPPAKCVVYTELLSTSRDFIKTVTAVDASWLRELVPQFFK